MTTNISDFGHGTLTLGGTETICQITNATLSGSNTRQDILTACGTTSRYINERFDFRVRFAQDWTAGGISAFLWDHYNQEVGFVFSPDPDGTPKMSGTLVCPRPSMGGDAGQPMVDDLTAPVVGVPTRVLDV
jgi:hypothetical protein